MSHSGSVSNSYRISYVKLLWGWGYNNQPYLTNRNASKSAASDNSYELIWASLQVGPCSLSILFFSLWLNYALSKECYRIDSGRAFVQCRPANSHLKTMRTFCLYDAFFPSMIYMVCGGSSSLRRFTSGELLTL